MQRLLLLQREYMIKFQLFEGTGTPCLGSERGSYMAGRILRLALQVVGKGTHGRRERRPESALLGAGYSPGALSYLGWFPGLTSLEGIQDAAGHMLLLDSCCPAYQGSACPSLPEQCRGFPGARMVHPVPQAAPPRSQHKLPARALLSMGSRDQVQRHFPLSPPHCPFGLRHLEWRSVPFAVPRC